MTLTKRIIKKDIHRILRYCYMDEFISGIWMEKERKIVIFVFS